MKRTLITFAFCIATCYMLTSCGLIWQKQKKDFAKKLYSEYPTEEGDEPYEPSIVTKFGGVKDTFLIVKNGEQYFRISKDGERTEVKYYRVRK